MFFTPSSAAPLTPTHPALPTWLCNVFDGHAGATAGGSGQPAGYTVTQDDKHTTLQLDVPGLSREQLEHHHRRQWSKCKAWKARPAAFSAPGNWRRTLTPPPALPSLKTVFSR